MQAVKYVNNKYADFGNRKRFIQKYVAKIAIFNRANYFSETYMV